MTDRRDLGAMLQRMLGEVLDRERVILADHNVQMWDYVALVRLDEGAAPTQTQLARAMGRDQTRVIQTLDRLQRQGLISRRPDPADRRNRMVALTPAGRRKLTACRTAIRAMERDLLGPLPAGDRSTFRRLLGALDDAVRTDP